MTNVRLDNDLFYLKKIDSAGLQENLYFLESVPEYSILFLTENEDSTFSKKKIVFANPRNITVNFHKKPCIDTETNWLITIFAKDSSGKKVYGSSYDLESLNTQFEYLDNNSCTSKTRIQSSKFHTMAPGEYIAVLKVGKAFRNAVDFTIPQH